MILSRIICLLTVLLFSFSLFAQQPLNFDFEEMSVEGIARPWGWSVFMLPSGAEISLDSTIKQNGKFSLQFFSENKTESDSGPSLGYWLSPYELTGKKLVLRGLVKTEKMNGFVQAIIIAYGDTGLIKEVKSADFQSVTDWNPFEIEFSINTHAHSYYVILNMSGGGKAWFDGFHLTVDGVEKQSLEVADDFNKEQRNWLEKNTSVITNVNPKVQGEQTDYSDLESFRLAVGDAKIIALGEATHGTSEFFKLKHRLLQYAVQELGVRVFAIEANQLEVEKINRYVQKGKGTAEQVIKVMFRVWNTEEMLALIKWMRTYNLQNPSRRIEFVGFDLQDPSLPMDSLSHFISDREPALLPVIDSLQHSYREAWRERDYPQAADSVRAEWKTNSDLVLELFSERKSTWLGEAKSEEGKIRVEWAIQNATVVSQAADIAYSQIVSRRDTFMAENIRWIESQRKPGNRIIVWAHDSHIARGDAPDFQYNYHSGESMGSYLSDMYGDNYRAFGLFTYGGQYSATISYTNYKVVPVDAMTAPRGSFDEALHRLAKEAGMNQLFLNLRPALKEKNNDWLLQPRPVRFVGYATSDFDFGAVMSVPYQFDGVFFVDWTAASRMLR